MGNPFADNFTNVAPINLVDGQLHFVIILQAVVVVDIPHSSCTRQSFVDHTPASKLLDRRAGVHLFDDDL